MDHASTSPRSERHVCKWRSASCALCSLLSVQDPHQPGLQQRRHSRGSQAERLPAELGETALKKQRHQAAELTAATHLCNERIEVPSLLLPMQHF